MSAGPPQPDTPARVEVCEKHGLRYNAAVDDGCARCRTEAGDRAMSGAAFAVRREPDVGKGLLIAIALVVGAGLSLFGAHSIVYNVGQAMVDGAFDEVLEGPTSEEAFEEAEPLPTPEDGDLDAVFEQLIGDG